MYNAFIWSFDEEFIKGAILKLAEERVIDIKYWVGFKYYCRQCTHEIHDVWNGKLEPGYFKGYNVEVYEEVFKHIMQFIDQYSRHYMPNMKSFHDYVNIFNMYLDYYYNFILDNDVQLFIFIDLPHDGVDLIAYLIAKQLNRNVIILNASLFADKFFHVSDINDFGTFSTSCQQAEECTEVELENKFEKDLFYMKQQKKRHSLKLQKKIYKKQIARKVSALDWLIHQLQKYSAKNKYRNNMERHSVQKVDMKHKYVYFPLHMQPEMTTSILGGEYVDQLLAVERLRMMLPNDWYIYIKENPKQSYFMRGEDFFCRLSRIPNTVLLAKSYDTYVLLKNCQFLATITGTAGWEAITGGKSVMVFGNAWYKKFPGVFQYRPDLDAIWLADYQPSFEAVQEAFNKLLHKLPQGAVETSYTSIIPKYSHAYNHLKLYEFFKLQIQAMHFDLRCNIPPSKKPEA